MIEYLRNRALSSPLFYIIFYVTTVGSLFVTIMYPIFFMTPFIINSEHSVEMLNTGISAVKHTAPLWFHFTLWGISACMTAIGAMISDD